MVNRTSVIRDAIIVALCIITLLASGVFGATKLISTLRSTDMTDALAIEELLTRLRQIDLSGLFDLDKLFDSQQPANPAPSTPANNSYAEVTRVRFFEGDKKIPPMKERKYAEEFVIANTRYIFTEVSFKHHRYKQAASEIPLTIEYYNPAGKLVEKFERIAKIKKEWASASYVTGWDSRTIGSLEPGKYIVKLYAAGQMVGEYSFVLR